MPVESDTFEARLSANIDCCYDFWEEILNSKVIIMYTLFSGD